MKFLFLLNNVDCAVDPKIKELFTVFGSFQTELYKANQDLDKVLTPFNNELEKMFKGSVERKDRDLILHDIHIKFYKQENLRIKTQRCFYELAGSLNEIATFNDLKSVDSETKKQYKKVVRNFGVQVSELEKLFKKVQTTEFSTNMAKLIKNNYESKFEPGAITKFEEIDKACGKFYKALKKLVVDDQEHLIELLKYGYNDAAIELGLVMSKTTKGILFGVIGAVCLVVIALIVLFVCKRYEERNSQVKKKGSEEGDELQ